MDFETVKQKFQSYTGLVLVFSAIGIRASATFSFRNPFSEPISVNVKMFFGDANGKNAEESANALKQQSELFQQQMKQILTGNKVLAGSLPAQAEQSSLREQQLLDRIAKQESDFALLKEKC